MSEAHDPRWAMTLDCGRCGRTLTSTEPISVDQVLAAHHATGCKAKRAPFIRRRG